MRGSRFEKENDGHGDRIDVRSGSADAFRRRRHDPHPCALVSCQRLLPLALCRADARTAAHCAHRPEDRRPHRRPRHLCRPLGVLRRRRRRRRLLGLRCRTAQRGLVAPAPCLRLAAAPARLGHEGLALECPQPHRRVDSFLRAPRPDRLAAGHPGAAHQRLAVADAADPRRLRFCLLPPLHSLAHPSGPPPAARRL